MLKKLFLSVGAMKAGTTWLYEQLRDHPEIYFTPEKEIHYFANAIGIENQLNHRNRILKLKTLLEKTAKGNPTFIAQHLDEISWYVNYAKQREISNDWYARLFEDSANKVCADFSNLYCQMGADGWDNVRKVSEQIRVIYTLRNPLDRIWSHYKFHLKWIGQEDAVLDKGFESFKELLEKPFFWNNARYGHNYRQLKGNLHEDELMVLYFDDFRQDADGMLNKVQGFLGVQLLPSNQAKKDSKINKTKDISMPQEWRDYAIEKLAPEIDDMRTEGVWHEEWN